MKNGQISRFAQDEILFKLKSLAWLFCWLGWPWLNPPLWPPPPRIPSPPPPWPPRPPRWAPPPRLPPRPPIIFWLQSWSSDHWSRQLPSPNPKNARLSQVPQVWPLNHEMAMIFKTLKKAGSRQLLAAVGEQRATTNRRKIPFSNPKYLVKTNETTISTIFSNFY